MTTISKSRQQASAEIGYDPLTVIECGKIDSSPPNRNFYNDVRKFAVAFPADFGSLLTSGDALTAGLASFAFSEFGQDAEYFLEEAFQQLSNKRFRVRMDLLEGVASASRQLEEQHVRKLIEMCDDPSEDVRGRLVLVFSKLDPDKLLSIVTKNHLASKEEIDLLMEGRVSAILTMLGDFNEASPKKLVLGLASILRQWAVVSSEELGELERGSSQEIKYVSRCIKSSQYLRNSRKNQR